MKKIYTVIIILICISLIGIIFIQISWLKNMILLRQEQVKEKIDRAVGLVGEELNQYKGSYSAPSKNNSTMIFPDEFNLDFLRPLTIGKRFTATELEQKIRSAFHSVELDKLQI